MGEYTCILKTQNKPKHIKAEEKITIVYKFCYVVIPNQLKKFKQFFHHKSLN